MDSRVRGNDKGKVLKTYPTVSVTLNSPFIPPRREGDVPIIPYRFCPDSFLSGDIAADEGGEKQ